MYAHTQVMMSPTFDTAPTPDELADVGCPVEVARRIGVVARTCGTLPTWMAEMRRAALIEARAAGHTTDWLAARLGMARARIYTITGPLSELAARNAMPVGGAAPTGAQPFAKEAMP